MSLFTPLKFRYDLYRHGAATRAHYGVSFGKQAEEAFEMFKLNHLEPWEWAHFHMSHPDLSREAKRRFMSYNQVCVLHRELSPPNLRGITNKWIAFNLFRQFGLPTPRVYGFFDPVFGRTTDGKPLQDQNDLNRLLNRNDVTAFVIKPVLGSKGTGISVFTERRSDKFIRADGKDLSLREVFDLCRECCHLDSPKARGGAVIQERVQQHQFLEKINPTCTNTLRITTLIANDGSIEFLYHVLKLGRGNSAVDNIDKGAFVVDLNRDGILQPANVIHPDHIEVVESHPMTGASFSGGKLPYFEQALDLALEAQRHLSQLRTLGFDIAITDNGPTIIEANTWWGHPIQAELRRGIISDNVREILNEIIPPRK